MAQLNDFIDDPKFIATIKSAFTNLKDEINFGDHNSKKIITDLQDLHVDNNQFLNTLIEKSKNSSGIINGERGTGKTHLLLLSNDKLNSTINEHKTLSIYINLKNISFPENINAEMFNRIFSIHIYEQIQFQILRLLKSMKAENIFQELKLLFNKDDRETIKALTDALITIIDFKNISRLGNEKIFEISTGSLSLENYQKEINELCSKVNGSIKGKELSLSSEILGKQIEESSEKLLKNNDYLSYLNLSSVKDNLVILLNKLSLNSIVFYVDEWEKIYKDNIIQEYTANFIDKINGSPIYFWIAFVPGRGNLHQLVQGADLPHPINLDTSLIYEDSNHESSRCLNYFKDLVDKRLSKYLSSYQVDYSTLFRNEENFKELVIASMGNSRDFGLMLSECIDQYISYRTDVLTPGRPFQYISKGMIETAIKSHGQTKRNNIKFNNKVNIVLKNIEDFCRLKKSSHFAIEITKENIELLNTPEFSELFYQRLIHMRKKDVSNKVGDDEKRLNIYAIDYSCTYSLHKNENQFNFWLEYAPIHDKVRRYIYSPQEIYEQISLSEGESINCKNCKRIVNINTFQKLWEQNICPYCIENLF
ncbi:hypothetical protein ACQKP0_14840 [Heyndrickxia sp. NPDC080065]|uniref:hypothetical protein n=1 Tax=Heyndrickxia sp. NPDC080065 TaxID=3390568 RepID=UPI003D03E10A